MKKVISLLICCVILCTISCMPISAANDSVSPRFNNTIRVDTNFYIDSNGNANVSVGYTGYNGITTSARITILLEKRTVFFSWKDVQEWVITSNEYTADFVRSCAVSNGYYRVTVKFEISGSGGATDVFEEQIEDSY